MEIDILTIEEYTEKRDVFEKKAAQIYLAALFLYGLSNAKFYALKIDISNQTLQSKYAVPRTCYKVLKLEGGWIKINQHPQQQ